MNDTNEKKLFVDLTLMNNDSGLRGAQRHNVRGVQRILQALVASATVSLV